MSETLESQAAEAAETAPATDAPTVKTINALGRTFDIPAKPTVAFLAALADSADAQREDDETGMVIAGVAILRALLGRLQMRQINDRDADVIEEIVEAANEAYGVDSGN